MDHAGKESYTMTGNSEAEVIILDASTLEVHYCDDGRSRKHPCRKSPEHETQPIAVSAVGGA